VSTDAITRSILVIEDDSAIAEVLTYNLEKEGYVVSRASDGRDGLRQAQMSKPDLVILDLMLPGMDGIEICRELRADKETRHVAILMLTAKSEESDQLVGFHLGADDYVTKPFSMKVLLQRIRVLVSRRQKPAGETQDIIQLHGIKLDRVAHQVFWDETSLPLTPTEYRLLETMMRQPGRAFTRNDLLNSAIGTDTIVLERTIDVHVRSLRQKLGEAAIAIETVRGIGYRFARELSPTRTENA
jgi:two-component system phosphate regulon response regulator PhoB